MIPTDKEQLKYLLRQDFDSTSYKETHKSIIRISRELKNHIGKEFISQLESDFEGDYGVYELNKI